MLYGLAEGWCSICTSMDHVKGTCRGPAKTEEAITKAQAPSKEGHTQVKEEAITTWTAPTESLVSIHMHAPYVMLLNTELLSARSPKLQSNRQNEQHPPPYQEMDIQRCRVLTSN
jgi:hypothetical protein